MDQKKIKNVNLRMPHDLHAAAVALAQDEDRSLNSLIIRAVRDALQSSKESSK
jgi:predicted HicB family RNase H-like nuclease